MKNYNETKAYSQLKAFFKLAYEINLEKRIDIKTDLIEYYITEIEKDEDTAKIKVLKRVNKFFEVDEVDRRIILRKLDRIILEMNLD